LLLWCNINITVEILSEFCCQRFIINVTSLCSFIGATYIGIYVVLPFCGQELVGDFRGEDGTRSHRILANS